MLGLENVWGRSGGKFPSMFFAYEVKCDLGVHRGAKCLFHPDSGVPASQWNPLETNPRCDERDGDGKESCLRFS